MVSKNDLKEYAKKLMFDMNEEEYATLEKEFEIILKQMDLISKIDNISEVSPMTFPFALEKVDMREDIVNNTIDFDDLKVNAKDYESNQIKVVKVVE